MAEEKPKRALLYNPEIEQALLGALLTGNSAMERCDNLRAENFFDQIHQRIFEAIKVLVEDGNPANPITVNPMLPQAQDIGGKTTAQYLAGLCAHATTIIEVPSYAKEVVKLSAARGFDAAGAQMLTDLANGTPVEQATTDFCADVDAIRVNQASAKQTIVSIEDSSTAFVQRAIAIASGTVDDATKTGLTDLDEMMGGLCEGDLIVAAGRPGMGKSTLVSSIARQMAKKMCGVAFFSLEMPRNQIIPRFLADEAFNDGEFDTRGQPQDRLEYDRIAHPAKLPGSQIDRMLDADCRFAGLPMLIDFSSRLTMGEIAVRTRGMQAGLKAKFGAEMKLVVIDYIKHVQASNRYAGNRVYEVGEISAAAKQLAKDTGSTVMLLAQLSRAVENTDDKRPQLIHLRESGDLEADADNVLLLYREAYYLKNDPEVKNSGSAANTRLAQCGNDLEINLAKQRMGKTGWLKLFCDMGCSAIRSSSHGHKDDGQPDMQFDGFANR